MEPIQLTTTQALRLSFAERDLAILQLQKQLFVKNLEELDFKIMKALEEYNAAQSELDLDPENEYHLDKSGLLTTPEINDRSG